MTAKRAAVDLDRGSDVTRACEPFHDALGICVSAGRDADIGVDHTKVWRLAWNEQKIG
jgi:hypothetical protein